MPTITNTQAIGKLPPRKGAYNYLKIDADIVAQFKKGRATRLVCTINEKVHFSCGLNHYGDGNFFIIVANKHLKKLGIEVGAEVDYTIKEDPNPLGVEIPEVLLVFLEQDADAKAIFNKITDGKKRSLIYQVKAVKNIDRQIEIAQDFLHKEEQKLLAKTRKIVD